ncbi:MAG: sulfite exporter TauE/SafE family protein [Anaerolineales bacterium]|nr:sulfite exporter TauE/SafE family protein [Anaerolineales bacterium]
MSLLLPVGAGFVIGFLIGLTGMGGGALMTPFLLIVMKLDPVAAVGTDLVFAALTKIAGSAQHYRHGNVSFKQVLWMACGSLPASYVGAQIILHLNPQITQKIMPPVLGGILVLVGLIMMARALNVLHPRSIEDESWPNPIALIAVGSAGGLLVGMSSIGGGTVIMAMMIVFFTIPVNYLVGLDVVHGAVLATVAALTYALAGRTNWPLVSWLLIGSIPGVWLGVLSIKHIDKRIVRGVLSLLVIGAGINLLIGH